MQSSKVYQEKINTFLMKTSKSSLRVKNNAYIQFSALQKHCMKEGYSIISLIGWAEEFSFPMNNSPIQTKFITLPDIMNTVDVFLIKNGISKRELCRRMNYDRANFGKLYTRGKSINIGTLLKIIEALEITFIEFIITCLFLIDYE